MKIVVTAGAGALERPLLTCLLAAGHDVRVLGGSGHFLPIGVRPVPRGISLDDAIAGSGSVVHRLPESGDRIRSLSIARAAMDQRVPIVLVATAVADAVEDALEGHDGWTLQVATTLHPELDERLRGWHRDDVLTVPRRVLVQPVDAGELAERLVLLVRAGPAGRVPDFGGPAARPLDDVARAWLDARAGGAGRLVLVKGEAPWAFPTARRAVGRIGWEEYLLGGGEQTGCPEPEPGVASPLLPAFGRRAARATDPV